MRTASATARRLLVGSGYGCALLKRKRKTRWGNANGNCYNILIHIHYVRADALARRIETRYRLLRSPDAPLISVVTVGEIRAFAAESGWGAGKLQTLEDLLGYAIAIPIPFANVIENYVEVSEFSRRAGRVLGKNDLWIAATAKTTGATLLTTDKDFDHLAPALLARDWINPATTT